MIRVSKNPNVPLSLSTTQTYTGVDILQQLENDQHQKCYLCERRLCTDFQVEHLRSKENYPSLHQDWNNLFWVCGYCNGKKLHHFDEILSPIAVNIEDEVKQSVDFLNNQAVFEVLQETNAHTQTIELLNRIHNGTRRLRTKREENFFSYIIGVINGFLRLVDAYLGSPTAEKEALVREELQIDKECLGFKYWIVKSNSLLLEKFADNIVWNKQ